MKKIIINADDFGINTEVTNAIEQSIENGTITSTTILANGKCLQEVKRIFDKHPEISYGIHLCLSEFDSLTKSEVLFRYGLTDENGMFRKQALWGYKTFPEDLKKAIFKELCAQIELVQSYGIILDHADSHHLVHTTFEDLQEVFIEVLKKYKIHKIRVGETVKPIRIIFSNLKNKIKVETEENKYEDDNMQDDTISKNIVYRFFHLMSVWQSSLLINNKYKRCFKTTDYFYSVHSYLNTNRLKDERIYELMCHPGHPSIIYKSEMKKMLNSKLYSNPEIELITYKNI